MKKKFMSVIAICAACMLVMSACALNDGEDDGTITPGGTGTGGVGTTGGTEGETGGTGGTNTGDTTGGIGTGTTNDGSTNNSVTGGDNDTTDGIGGAAGKVINGIDNGINTSPTP